MKTFKEMLQKNLYYFYDGLCGTELGDEEVFKVEDKVSINLKQPKTEAEFVNLMDKAKQHIADNMIRFVFSYDDTKAKRLLPPVLNLNNFYAWYGCGRLKNTPFPEFLSCDLKNPYAITVEQMNSLGDNEKTTLIQKWQEQYIDTVLEPYPEKIKQQQLEKFIQGLDFKDSKSHYLFYKDGAIVGHYSMFIFDWPPFGGKALDPHRWIEQSLSKEERKIIHAKITDILKQNEHYAMGAGVVLNNEKSLKVLEQNGFIPLHLCVKAIN